MPQLLPPSPQNHIDMPTLRKHDHQPPITLARSPWYVISYVFYSMNLQF